MKHNYIFLLPLFLLTLLSSCRDQDYNELLTPASTPVIQSISFQPSTGVTYGDSVTLVADLQDDIPLSTLKVQVIINDEVVHSEIIRTAGPLVQLNKKLPIPFVVDAEAGAIDFSFTLTNSQGGKVTDEEQLNIARPAFSKLYLRLGDGTTYEMAQSNTDPDVFVTDSGEYPNSILAKVLSENDYSGFTWVSLEDEIVLGDEFSSFITLNNPAVLPYRVAFNTRTFSLYYIGEDLPSVYIGGNILLPASDGLFRGSFALQKDQVVTFAGIDDPNGALDPDFFSADGTDITFTGETGTYQLAYDKDKNFILVEQAGKVFPDGLWLTGVGVGKPVSAGLTTTSWGWDNAYQYFFCKKTGDKEFQITVYLENGDFKYFKGKGWGDGEFRFDTGFSYRSESFDFNSGGNFVQVGAPGIYRIILQLGTEGDYHLMATKLD